MNLDKAIKWIAVISSLSVFGTVFMMGVFSGDIQQRLFPTVYDQQRTLKTIDLIDPVVVVKTSMRDSIKRVNDSIAEAKHRALQDSMDSARDSLTKRTAVSLYQLKDYIEKKDKRDSLLMKGVLEHLREHDQ